MDFQTVLLCDQPRGGIVGQEPFSFNLKRQRQRLGFTGIQQSGLHPAYGAFSGRGLKRSELQPGRFSSRQNGSRSESSE